VSFLRTFSTFKLALFAAALVVAAGASASAQTAVGATGATQTATVTIATAGTLASINVLTQGATGKDFQELSPDGGTCFAKVGLLVAANSTCTVQYTFTPSRPGQRLGGIVLMGLTGPVGQTPIVGTGTGPLVEFPASTAVSTLGDGFGQPAGVAVDGSGNVFVAEADSDDVAEIEAGTGGNAAGVVSSSSTVVQVRGGLVGIFNIAVDGSGNVFFADTGYQAVQEIEAGTGGNAAGVVSSSSTVVTVGSGFNFPHGVTVDGSGNVFVADTNNRAVDEIEAGTGGNAAGVVSSSSTVVTVGSGFSSPFGVAVDGSGNVFVADTNNRAVKEIEAGTGGNAAGMVSSSSTVVAVGGSFSGPEGVVVDGSGHVFVADYFHNAVDEIDLTAPPALAFASTSIGNTSTDSPKSVTVQNAGNANLTISPQSSGNNPSVATNFTLANTSTCPSVASGGSAGTLAENGLCTYAFNFVPQANGTINGSAVVTDNSLNASAAMQTILLSGMGTRPPGTDTITPAAATITYGTTPTTLSAQLSYTYTQAPTGAVTFQVASGTIVTAACTGTASPLSCSASYPTGTLAAGNHTITASVATDANYASTSGSNTLTINKATPTITTPPTASGINYGQNLSASTLSGGSASTPGTFAFTNPATLPPAGTSSQSVTFTPNDTADYTTTTLTVSVTTGKATPTITTPPTASGINYGQSLSASTLSGGMASTPGTFAFTNPATMPPAGTSSQSVTFTPNDTADYTTITLTVSVTTGKATPTITTLPTASSITYGQSLSSSVLTGGVASTAGTFAFTNPATVPPLGTSTQTVIFTPTDLADYTVATLTIQVTVNPPPDFTFNVGPTQYATVVPGGSASYSFSIAPESGIYPGPVAFTVTGLPPGATYTLTPASIAQNGGPQTVVLAVKTRSPLAANELRPSPWKQIPLPALAFLLLPVFLSKRRRHMSRLMRTGLAVLVMAAGVAAVGSLTGCGTGNGFLEQPSTNYTLTVTATSGAASHTETVVLNVQ
jgi:sugar lactone lactonase YvrE